MSTDWPGQARVGHARVRCLFRSPVDHDIMPCPMMLMAINIPGFIQQNIHQSIRPAGWCVLPAGLFFPFFFVFFLRAVCRSLIYNIFTSPHASTHVAVTQIGDFCTPGFLLNQGWPIAVCCAALPVPTFPLLHPPRDPFRVEAEPFAVGTTPPAGTKRSILRIVIESVRGCAV